VAITTTATRSSTTNTVSRCTRSLRQPPAKQGDHARSERRIGRHGHAPRTGRPGPGIYRDVGRYRLRHRRDSHDNWHGE
jgi:hypothetical protein